MEHGKGSARPNRYQRRPRTCKPHPRRAAERSYSIAEVFAAIVAIVGIASIAWGYALVYQIGYDKGESYVAAQMATDGSEAVA